MNQNNPHDGNNRFQVILAKDRINFERLPITDPRGDLRALANTEFIPSVEDMFRLRDDVVQVYHITLITSASFS